MKKFYILFLMLFISVSSFGQSPYEKMNSLIQPQDAKKDIDLWSDWLHATHPDLSYTVKNIDKFYSTVTQIKDSVNSPITGFEFWRRLTPLNSQLSDGHLNVGSVGGTFLKDYLSKGGKLFPLALVFDKNELLISTNLDGTPSDYKGYSITQINNVQINTITETLLLRINGDSEVQRKAMLQRKFSLFYLLMYGETENFTIGLKKGDLTKNISVTSVSTLPLFYRDAGFAENFQFNILNKTAALLTINEFGWKDEKEYYNFMDSAFAKIKQNNIRHLIIDIRNNGGGDDIFWRQGILKYIADKPYQWGSNYKKKIIAKYRDEGQVIGQVFSGKIETIIPVEANNPYKFDGKVSVLIGPYTYSSSILFANTVQDYAFAELVGMPTGGKSGQTGSIQFLTMPASGLTAVSPRFYLERPHGGKMQEPVTPDIKIEYSELAPNELIDKILP